jgi:hypothetical protein
MIDPPRVDDARVGRLLRKAAMVVLLGVSAVFIVLWVRNFWRADVVWIPLPNQGYVLLASYQGQMELALYFPSSPARVSPRLASPRWGLQSYTATWKELHEITLPHAKPLRYRRLPLSRQLNMIAPYWFLIPATWLVAAAPCVRWSRRFSLRALMIGMTLFAVALGIYVSSGW